MTTNVAVEEPHTWIVRIEPQVCPASAGQVGGILHGRVDEVELGVVIGRLVVASAGSGVQVVTTASGTHGG